VIFDAPARPRACCNCIHFRRPAMDLPQGAGTCVGPGGVAVQSLPDHRGRAWMGRLTHPDHVAECFVSDEQGRRR
jgi:hypothetical protein